jgi:integrase
MAAKRDFTDRYLKAIKPAPTGKRSLYLDAQVPGFGVRVTDNSAPGTGSFVLVARFPGSDNPTARRIGDYPAMSLTRAREIARGWRDDLRQGIDPKIKMERARQEEARQRAQTFKAGFEAYADDRLTNLRSGAVVRSIVARLTYPAWGYRPLREITRADAKELIRKVAQKTPVNANRLLAYLKTFGTWAIDEELIDNSPFASIRRPTSEKDRARDRTLSDIEIRTIWHACDQLGVFGRAFKIMLLTGQRRTEVGAMRWSELHMRDKVWKLSKSRTKAKRAHEVPLSDAAIEIIGMMPRLGDCVFSSGRRRSGDGGDDRAYGPISGWGKAKEALDRFVTVRAREIAEETGDEDAVTIQPWTLHDFRRTCATRLGKLGVPRVVISKVLNHAIPGVTSTYDRNEYELEKRAALDRWAAHLQGIVDGTGDNVVSLADARAS